MLGMGLLLAAVLFHLVGLGDRLVLFLTGVIGGLGLIPVFFGAREELRRSIS